MVPVAVTRAAALRARLGEVLARALAVVEPRIMAAGAWLHERRLHVFIIAATAATIVLFGGTVALLQLTGSPGQQDDAAPAAQTARPTSSIPARVSSLPPILPTPVAPTPLPPLASEPDAEPDADAGPPTPDDGEAVVPTAAPPPEPERGRGRDRDRDRDDHRDDRDSTSTQTPEPGPDGDDEDD